MLNKVATVAVIIGQGTAKPAAEVVEAAELLGGWCDQGAARL